MMKSRFLPYLLILPMTLQAQYKLNFGLSQPQDPATLPKSKVPVVFPEKKAKRQEACTLVPAPDREWILSGGWELCEEDRAGATGEVLSLPGTLTPDWLNARVPGTVLTSLVEEGVYPDPYFGVNNLTIPDTLCRQNWWYRTEFPSPAEPSGKVWLILNGVNYRAVVFLNGHRVGTVNGAFSRGQFDVSRLIHRKGLNALAVKILPPPNPGIPHEESPSAGTGPNGGQLCLDGPTFISSEGWDWIPGIRDRNAGIWQDIRLRVTGEVILVDPQVMTRLPLPDTTSADLLIRTELRNTSSRKRTVTLSGMMGSLTFSEPVTLAPGEIRQIQLTPRSHPQLTLKNPDLWWPNGYGRQPLYRLSLKVTGDGRTEDEKTIRFGIRELTYELTADLPGQPGARVEFVPMKNPDTGIPLLEFNRARVFKESISIAPLADSAGLDRLVPLADSSLSPYLVIRVNGHRIFCKGGNWGMDDGLKRVSRDRLEPYFRLHQQANFTMIRNWTGESTESVFYDLADEYGLLVWNDFWLSTGGYNLNPNDNLLFLDNAREAVRRFRNHPSIAVWCARNEGVPLPQLESQLETLMAKEDPSRHYTPDSRALNLRWSGPWHYQKDPSVYFTGIAGGFSTELGTPSVPTAETIRSMMAEADTWPIGDVWYYHDLHDGQTDYLAAIDRKYGPSGSLDEFCRKAQLVNYDSHRAMFEAWNSLLWKKTSGLLLWMSHPAWPSTVWQVYSSDYETFGSYFGSKKACEPVHVQLTLPDERIQVINTGLVDLTGATLKVTLYGLDGLPVFTGGTRVSSPGNSVTEYTGIHLPSDRPEVYLIRLELTDRNRNLLSVNEYWKSRRDEFTTFNRLGKPVLEQTEIPGQPDQTWHVTNTGAVPAVAVQFSLRDPVTGNRILPAIFSDGFRTLLPGESVRVSVQVPDGRSGLLQISTY